VTARAKRADSGVDSSTSPGSTSFVRCSSSPPTFASDVIVIPCTTTLSIAPTHVRVRKGEAGLPAASVVKCEQITTLHKDDVRHGALGGALPPKRILEIERAILCAIGVPVPLEPD
jgi:mRNA-degrading endonuclease toxin of MazEF toxin-antitoxin module